MHLLHYAPLALIVISLKYLEILFIVDVIPPHLIYSFGLIGQQDVLILLDLLFHLLFRNA